MQFQFHTRIGKTFEFVVIRKLSNSLECQAEDSECRIRYLLFTRNRQLQQVLMNLMMNSIDAVKDVDGTRELTIQSQREEHGQVLISVSDTGVGLPPQQGKKIFDAFFTTKTSRHRHGIADQPLHC
jgi:signal transduction histidine kinase